MAYMPHPDDVKQRNWEFLVSDRFPDAPRVEMEDGWVNRIPEAKGCYSLRKARADIVNAWPAPFDVTASLAPQIAAYEAELDRVLGIGKPPAVSEPIRGETENRDQGNIFTQRTVRPFRCSCGGSWNQMAYEREERPCHRKDCGKSCWAGKSATYNDRRNDARERQRVKNGKPQCVGCKGTPAAGEDMCRKCREFAELGQKQQRVLRDFSEQGIIAGAEVLSGVVGINIYGTDMTCRHDPPTGFMPLKEAQDYVNGLELDGMRQRLINAMAVPDVTAGKMSSREIERMKDAFSRKYDKSERMGRVIERTNPLDDTFIY